MVIACGFLLACAKSAPEPIRVNEAGAATEEARANLTRATPALPAALGSAGESARGAGALPSAYATTISEAFALEAKNRPTGTPTAEAVFATFQNAGLRLSDSRQHAARAFAASYCAGAKAEPDLHMSVCEYPDEASAIAGRAASARMFGSVPNREVWVRGKTTLAIRQGTKTPESEGNAQKMADLFGKMGGT